MTEKPACDALAVGLAAEDALALGVTDADTLALLEAEMLDERDALDADERTAEPEALAEATEEGAPEPEALALTDDAPPVGVAVTVTVWVTVIVSSLSSSVVDADAVGAADERVPVEEVAPTDERTLATEAVEELPAARVDAADRVEAPVFDADTPAGLYGIASDAVVHAGV
jgi:hypothetical protein